MAPRSFRVRLALFAPSRALARVLTASLLFAAPAFAQCGEWSRAFGVPGQYIFSGRGVVYDAGDGPYLYISGQRDSRDPLQCGGLARWDGVTLSSFGTGLLNGTGDGTATAMLTHDDGSGECLYLGGSFTSVDGVAALRIARWNGTVWSPVGLGLDGTPTCMYVADIGDGPKLYVAGNFQHAGGVFVRGLARWDGAQWSAVAPANYDMTSTRSIIAFDDGNGLQLYFAGNLPSQQPLRSISRWDGTTWSGVGPQTFDHGGVSTMVVWDDGLGGGPRLWLGGAMQSWGNLAGCGGLARWIPETNSWQAPTGVEGGGVGSLLPYDDGSGPKLWVSGSFNKVGSTLNAFGVAAWNGTSWSTIPTAPSSIAGKLVPVSLPVGSPTRLFVPGRLEPLGQTCGLWDGNSLRPLVRSLAAPGGGVSLLASVENGGHTRLYGLVGSTTSPGFSAISELTPEGWVQIASPVSNVTKFVVFDDGSGPALFVAGSFAQIAGVTALSVAKYDGSQWHGFQSSAFGTLTDIAVFDGGAGPELYATTETSIAPPGAGALWRWNGSSWAAVSGGTFTSVPRVLRAFTPPGQPPQLFVGGSFTTVNGQPASHIASWDGTQWRTLAGGLSGEPNAMMGFEPTGSGAPTLIVSQSGTSPLMRWDGTTWSAVTEPGTLDSGARALVTMTVGGEQWLFVGGAISSTPGGPVQNIARWNGVQWTALGSGLPSFVKTLCVHDDLSGAAPQLFVGSTSAFAGGVPSVGIARWVDPCAANSVTTFCQGDGVALGCPCGNNAPIGAQGGCVSSLGLSGRLVGTGEASLSADFFVLRASQLTTSTTLFFQGTLREAGGTGSLLGDGIKCAGGNLIRLGQRLAIGGETRAPLPGALPISARGAILAPGTRTYQAWYRNSAAAWCPPQTFNLTNGVEVSWAP